VGGGRGRTLRGTAAPPPLPLARCFLGCCGPLGRCCRRPPPAPGACTPGGGQEAGWLALCLPWGWIAAAGLQHGGLRCPAQVRPAAGGPGGAEGGVRCAEGAAAEGAQRPRRRGNMGGGGAWRGGGRGAEAAAARLPAAAGRGDGRPCAAPVAAAAGGPPGRAVPPGPRQRQAVHAAGGGPAAAASRWARGGGPLRAPAYTRARARACAWEGAALLARGQPARPRPPPAP
jgi:hypothetical protein